MRYNQIDSCECCNGIGIGVSLCLQGCPIRCPDCHNKVTWDFAGGKKYTDETQQQILKLLQQKYITRLSLYGGEPMMQDNIYPLGQLIDAARQEKPDLKVWVWTGFTIEYLMERNPITFFDFLNKIDYLIDGPFIQEKKDLTLAFRGSSNQRVINAKESIKQHKIIIANFDD